MKIKHTNKSWLAIASSGALLLLLVVAMLCPMRSDRADAAECTDQDPSACPTQAMSTRASVNVATTISVALDSGVSLDVAPDASGQFASATANLSVSTNSAAGYKLLLSTSGSDNALIGPVSGEARAKINALGQSTTKANFPNNAWGYNLGTSGTIVDTTTFSPVPVSTAQTIIKETDAPSNDTYSLNFGAKVNNSLVSGEYTNEIVVSAIANPKILHDLADLTDMQQMTTSICVASSEGDTKQLTDTRDGKPYWVAKLADGNCWMTQNLALDITTAGLKAADTDIDVDWNASSTYPPVKTETTLPTSNDDTYTVVQSWNLGEYQLVNPTVANECESAMNIETCVSQGIITASITDEHYTLGNYYTWNAATAGTGGTIAEDADVSGSICPKNWQLPGVRSRNSTHPTFADLLAKYGITSSVSGTIDGKTYNVAGAPLYFVRGGAPYYRPRTQTGSSSWDEEARFYKLGWRGEYNVSYASGYSSAGSSAYGLTVSDSVNSDEYSLLRSKAKSVRCVAR